MNLLIPHSWFKDYCKTSLTPEKIAGRVSLSGPSIDRVHIVDGDALYDVEITTNRPDAFSIIGFAREVAAILSLPFTEPLDVARRDKRILALAKKARVAAKKDDRPPYTLSVSIKASNVCNRYIGVVLDHVVIKPSPDWLASRLIACGQRPINNVVDITNYVMLEYGQPMHAFDADKIFTKNEKGEASLFHKEIIVRTARKGEAFTTLDGEKKSLNESMLVIADDQGPLALAGIKGGQRAGIDSQTNTVILEAAHFDAVNVRTTSRKVDIRTDSSSRFEKKLSANLPPFAMLRAIELLEQCAQARVVSPLIDAYPVKEKNTTIRFSPQLIKRILGADIAPVEVKRCLTALGFKTRSSGKQIMTTVPFWRAGDVEKEIDLVEEVARIHGYTSLPIESVRGSVPLASRDPSFSWEKEAKHFLKNAGWTEVMTYSFVSEKLLAMGGVSMGACVRLHNPLSLEFEYLRPTLLPSILGVIADNEQKQDELRVFELANVYHPIKKNKLPDEPLMLVGAVMKKAKEHDLFLEVKGLCEALAHELFGRENRQVSFEKGEAKHGFAQGKTALLKFGSDIIGQCGIPDEGSLSRFGIKTPVALFEFSFSKALPFMSSARQFVPLPKYPSVERDVAVVLDKSHAYDTIASALKSFNGLITGIELFDVFENQKLGIDKQSLAFHILYSAPERTLQAEEVDVIHENLKRLLERDFGAQIR